MQIKDRNFRIMVNVAEKNCPKYKCYWPRADPGVFTQGVGYKERNPGKRAEWLCGTREIDGCPQTKLLK